MPEQGLFLPTTEIIDLERLRGEKISDDQLREIIIRIVQAFNESNIAVNLKDTGIYSLQEFVNGQTFFPDPSLSSLTAEVPELRQIFRKVINFGGLPNAGTTTIAHSITIDAVTQPLITFTRIYGCATDLLTPEYIPLPYSSTVAVTDNIELAVDATNVSIRTGIDRTAFTTCYVVLEYLKQ